MSTTSSRLRPSFHWHADTLLVWLLRGLATVAAAIVLAIVTFLLVESIPALLQVGVLRFTTDASWYPTSGQFNAMPMVAGTLMVSAGAILLAAPLGIGSAVFGRFCAPVLVAGVYRRVIELLAGIPSVVYGFWGLVVIVPLITHSLLAGVLILALMILPTVALIADAALAAVPSEYLRGAAALGLTNWSTLRHVAIPAARSGLVTAVILATGRAVGETMAVLMVTGNVVQLPANVLDPIRTLTANIALEMAYATDLHRSALFATGLVLMALVGVLVAAAEYVSRGPGDA